MLRQNLVANYIGQAWAALMGLAFIPLYIEYVGMEAYGLIAVYAMLVAWFAVLDMGITPTLGREMALFLGGGHTSHSIRELLRTLELVALSAALFTALSLALAAGWLSRHWLSAEDLSESVIREALSIMGCVMALRLLEGIYRSSIIGLQRQVVLNVINVVFSTLRSLGAVAVLVFISPTIKAFFLWQAAVSLISLIALAMTTYSTLPPPTGRARFSVSALKTVRRFAGGMIGITLLATLLMNVDKVLLSKLLTLAEYGLYALAAVAAGGLYMLIAPITQALFPKLCELQALGNQAALAKAFHQGAQLVSVVAGSAAMVLIFFAETFLRLWTQDGVIAAQAAPLLSTLMLGNLLNGLMWVPYQAQLAHGWTGLTVKVNFVAVLVVVPLVVLATQRYGAQGAAWIWVGLNAGYVMITMQLMHRRILISEKWRWYCNDLFLPLAAGGTCAFTLKVYCPPTNTTLSEIGLLVAAAVTTFLVMCLAAREVRQVVSATLRAVWTSWRSVHGQ